jgi:hypothetical protein
MWAPATLFGLLGGAMWLFNRQQIIRKSESEAKKEANR